MKKYFLFSFLFLNSINIFCEKQSWTEYFSNKRIQALCYMVNYNPESAPYLSDLMKNTSYRQLCNNEMKKFYEEFYLFEVKKGHENTEFANLLKKIIKICSSH